MSLELRPMNSSDALSWVRIRSLAYYGPTHDLLHTGLVRESSIRAIAEDRKNEIGQLGIWHWKIVDTSLPPSEDDPENNGGRTIATAVWSMQNSRTDDEKEERGSQESSSIPLKNMRNPRRGSFLPPELRLDALASIFGPLDESREDIMGNEKPYLMLNSLSTHPEQRGRGAAAMLLEWGLQKADRESLTTYLDSTEMARPIYEKRGFELKKGLDWDRVPWGGKGKDWHGCMVRRPHTYAAMIY